MSNAPRVTDAILVIVDISGYTRFVQQRPVSLQHAEAIVTELIEAIIDRADNPLVVNKLEGDAALLYLETQGDLRAASAGVFAQLADFFTAFKASTARIKAARTHCNCDACANIDSLQLKAFLHVGEIVVKQVRQFEEIAGEAVIMVHRMTKNSLPLHEYVLMTEAIHAATGDAIPDLRPQQETIDGVPTVLHWCSVDALHRCLPALSPISAHEPPANTADVQRVARFHHLPKAEAPAANATWWTRLIIWLHLR